MLELHVKSSSHIYNVKFFKNIKEELEEVIQNDDFIICDSKVSKIYSTLFDNTFKEANFIIIEAREDNKSYEGLIPIIDELINLGFKKITDLSP